MFVHIHRTQTIAADHPGRLVPIHLHFDAVPAPAGAPGHGALDRGEAVAIFALAAGKRLRRVAALPAQFGKVVVARAVACRHDQILTVLLALGVAEVPEQIKPNAANHAAAVALGLVLLRMRFDFLSAQVQQCSAPGVFLPEAVVPHVFVRLQLRNTALLALRRFRMVPCLRALEVERARREQRGHGGLHWRPALDGVLLLRPALGLEGNAGVVPVHRRALAVAVDDDQLVAGRVVFVVVGPAPRFQASVDVIVLALTLAAALHRHGELRIVAAYAPLPLRPVSVALQDVGNLLVQGPVPEHAAVHPLPRKPQPRPEHRPVGRHAGITAHQREFRHVPGEPAQRAVRLDQGHR